MVRRELEWTREQQQRAESATDLVTPDMGEGELEFRACVECAEKLKWDPLQDDLNLCEACDHNRDVFRRLKEEQAKQARWLIGAAVDRGKLRAQAYEDMAEWHEEQASGYDGARLGEAHRKRAHERSAAECRRRAKEAGK